MQALADVGRRGPSELTHGSRSGSASPMLSALALTALVHNAAPAPASTPGVEPSPPPSQRAPRLRRHLTRDLPAGPRFLDHGVLEVGAAGGLPHLYRVQLRLGLLDHLTLGATAHWLPGQKTPAWSPLITAAFWRHRWLEVGAGYHQLLHPPPPIDEDPQTPAFQSRTHYVMGIVTFSQAWLSAGFDLGVANLRVPDDSQTEDETLYVTRTRLGGGLHLRFGTRRFGITVQGQAPDLSVEALLDVRFGLFEMRRRGGWLRY